MTVAPSTLTTDDLDFVLPDALVAQQPAPERGGSRLMVLQAGEAAPRTIGRFDALLLDQLRADDLVVANDSRVLHARVPVVRDTGGRGEVLLLAPVAEQVSDDNASGTAGGAARGAARGTARGAARGATGGTETCRWTAMARPARKYRDGQQVATPHGDASITMVERSGAQTWTVELPCSLDEVPGWLLEHGELPLPPYVTERGQDDGRYQTVHARHDGSVAAPTAGLHFSEELWSQIAAKCEVAHVTLHVGAGTFLPVNDGPLSEHVMHHERYEVPAATDAAVRRALAEGRRVVAIGTTSTRTLEHVYGSRGDGALTGSTDLFIQPGYAWACVGAMLTNFHLPKSTLVALVMAFHGMDATRAAYQRAIAEQMRFYSFGDAMFVHGPPATAARDAL